jgi:DNA ligase D-like protein (predicted 3'-phosphoesterase)
MPASGKRYADKRDFRKTPEPQDDAADRPGDGAPIFVIQRHDASREHYDFRLEVAGVLKSWAVPRGPSTDPREKRLALPTEDHPLGYADFEGVIPEDQYGGGTVMIWDRGTFENLTEDDQGAVPVERALEDGHLVVRLAGEKIRGGYALQRTGGGGDDARWLLVKTRDDEADARRNPVSTEPDSVASGRSLEEIAAQEADADQERDHHG